MAKMKEIICKCGCGRKKMVRVADIKRGWGKYYSKSCKARDQATHYHNIDDEDIGENDHPHSSEALGQWL